MSHGIGKYDPECVELLQETSAESCVIIILGGNKGSGFSVNFRADCMHKIAMVPKALRDVANQIEADLRKLQQ